MATQHTTPPPDNDPEDNVVEADQDPTSAEIERLENESEEETALARAQARLGYWEAQVGADRIREGRKADGDALLHDATEQYNAAADTMAHVDKEIHEAELLRDKKRQELSRELREWSDQSFVTLRDAVRSVSEHVAQMSDHDVRRIVRASAYTEDDVTVKREQIFVTGQSIEITLNSFNAVRRDPYALLKNLATFTTVAYELAHYLPSLMEKLAEFGRLLLQFHF